jgi:hypothetical protein
MPHISTEKPKKFPGIDQILAELNQAGDKTLPSENHRLICIAFYKEGNKSACSNY